MEIILLRHGKPVIPPLNIVSASAFKTWVNIYNSSGLCVTSQPTFNTINTAQKCNAIVCSNLTRSIESALALNIKHITLISSIFNESGLPVAHWRLVKLSPKAWAVLFRIFWLFGYSRNSESFKQSRTRASGAASILINLARKHERVLFVGHGVYNQLLANELKASGWAGPRRPETKHWSYSIYTSNNSSI